MLKRFGFRTPIRLQINPIECGAVALGIILDYYRYPNTQSQLNTVVGISRNGSDAAALIKGAKHFGVQASGKMLSASEIKTSPKPSIAFFDSCHFVVLEGYHFGKYFINDPASGRYSLDDKEFRHRYSGVEISIKGQWQAPRPRTPFGIGNFSIGIMGGILLGVFIFSLTKTLSLMHGAPLNVLLISCLGLALLFSMYLCLTRFLMIATIDKKETEFQQKFIAHSTKLNPAFFETRPFARYRAVIDSISSMTPHRSVIFGAIFSLCLFQALVFWPFSLILILLVLGIGLISIDRTSSQKKTDTLAETMEKFPHLDAMGQGRDLITRQLFFDHERAGEHYQHLKSSKTRTMFIVSFSLLALAGVSSLAPSYLNLGSLHHGEVLGTLSLVLLVAHLASLVFKKPANNDEYRRALLSEMEAMISEEPSIASSKTADSIFTISHGSFAYPGESRDIFSDLTIELKAATLYGVVGAAGTGKSTLLRLIGQKLSLRSGHLAMASSKGEKIAFTLIDDDAELFAGTLLENVRVFDTRYSEHQVSEALTQAAIEELFYHRPMGLLTHLDHGGANISGGQKKRLLLARALLHKAPLIVLDNFFDSLDRECSERVLRNLAQQHSAVVFSSFRNWELAKSDQVIFIEESRVSIASHDYWMKHSPTYQSLISHDETGKKIL